MGLRENWFFRCWKGGEVQTTVAELLAGVTANQSACWSCRRWHSLPFDLGRPPRQQVASSCWMMTNDLTLMKRGKRPRAALQALWSEAAAMRRSPKLSQGSRQQMEASLKDTLWCYQGGRQQASCCLCWRKYKINKLVVVFSRVVTAANIWIWYGGCVALQA